MDKLINYDHLEISLRKFKTYIDTALDDYIDISTYNELVDGVNDISRAFADLETSIITDVNNAINSSEQGMFAVLEESYVSKAEHDLFTSDTNERINQLNDGVNIRLNIASSNIETLGSQLNKFKDSIESSITFNEDEVNIKKDTYEFNVSKEKISLIENSNEIVSIDDNRMNVSDVNVSNSISMNNFRIIPGALGNMSIIWDDLGNLINASYAYPNVTTTGYLVHIAYFYQQLVPGEIYTIEIGGYIYGRDYYGIYNSGGMVMPVSIDHEHFIKGVAKKSFIWTDNNNGADKADNTSIHIYGVPFKNDDGSYSYESLPTVNVSYVKMFAGDDYWKNEDNLLSYNNVFTEDNKYGFTAWQKDSFGYTNVYAYLEAGKTYEFSCKCNKPWSGENEEGDFCEAYLSPLGTRKNHIHMGRNPFRFTVPTTDRWEVRVDGEIQNEDYYYWDMKIVEVGGDN